MAAVLSGPDASASASSQRRKTSRDTPATMFDKSWSVSGEVPLQNLVHAPCAKTTRVPVWLRRTAKRRATLGQALIDGNFDHVGKIKGPILRGVSARAPYFHNGSAQSLLDAVRFYEKRFGLMLTPQEESDLVAFLKSL
jgi:cytochrome c peroxidase